MSMILVFLEFVAMRKIIDFVGGNSTLDLNLTKPSKDIELILTRNLNQMQISQFFHINDINSNEYYLIETNVSAAG